MQANYSFIPTQTELNIHIHPYEKPVVRLSHYVMAFLFICLGSLFIPFFLKLNIQDLFELDLGFVFILFVLLLFALYIFAGISLLKNTTLKEKIVLYNTGITLKLNSLISQKEISMQWNDITSIEVSQPDEETEHPMAGKSMDYIGLQTMEKDIRNVLTEGSICIITKAGSYKIGRHLASWDAEEIIAGIVQYKQEHFQDMSVHKTQNNNIDSHGHE